MEYRVGVPTNTKCNQNPVNILGHEKMDKYAVIIYSFYVDYA